MVYPPIMNMYMNNMSNMSNNMILAGHSKGFHLDDNIELNKLLQKNANNFCVIPAVVSSQDGYQQALSEIDQLFSTRTEDEFINPGIKL